MKESLGDEKGSEMSGDLKDRLTGRAELVEEKGGRQEQADGFAEGGLEGAAVRVFVEAVRGEYLP